MDYCTKAECHNNITVKLFRAEVVWVLWCTFDSLEVASLRPSAFGLTLSGSNESEFC